MLSIKLEVVRPKGISVIFSALLLLSFSIFALILTFPPRIPSQYLLTSIIPPVGKSGVNHRLHKLAAIAEDIEQSAEATENKVIK